MNGTSIFPPSQSGMPITELAILQLKPGKDWSDISPHIRTAKIAQAKWSGYPLHFFDVQSRTGEIVLMSGWESVEEHQKWIASETNQDLLRVLQPLLDVTSLLHLSIEPSSIWSGVEVMVYEKVGEESLATSPPFSSEDVVWGDEGYDVEGKVEGSFKLVALKSVKALEALDDLPQNDKKRIAKLVHHEIPHAGTS